MPSNRADLPSRSGRLAAERHGDRIRLDLPARPPSAASLPPGVTEALGIAPVRAARSGNDLLIEVAKAAAIPSLQPDFAALAAVEARLVIVTATDETGRHDVVSRVFAPRVGIDEDPVTGAAHCLLAPYWSARLGKDEMTALQASARSGEIDMRLAGDRVIVAGRAITTVEGRLHG